MYINTGHAHNRDETLKRREKINERMDTLRKMIKKMEGQHMVLRLEEAIYEAEDIVAAYEENGGQLDMDIAEKADSLYGNLLYQYDEDTPRYAKNDRHTFNERGKSAIRKLHEVFKVAQTLTPWTDPVMGEDAIIVSRADIYGYDGSNHDANTCVKIFNELSDAYIRVLTVTTNTNEKMFMHVDKGAGVVGLNTVVAYRMYGAAEYSKGTLREALDYMADMVRTPDWETSDALYGDDDEW